MSPRRVLVFSVLVGLVGLLAACGDDVVTPPPDAGADAGLDASAVCTSSAECGNGMYCDGVETCAPGTVGASARGCVAGTPPCATAETCLEDTDACRSCSIDDADGDGVSGCDADCDDTDAARYPGNTELCDYDGHDEDCDDTTFGAKDDDGDGVTDARCCNGTTCGLDCDDARGGVHAGVPEVCNGRDDDCNGVVDDGGVLVSGYADADRDLYGAGPLLMACAGTGLSVNATDCDDAPPGGGRASPGFGEVLGDGVDNDCDGEVDETGGPSALWYRDADGDGFGDEADSQTSSTILLGYVLLPGDCDDANAARSPLVAELCNGLDDDCNDLADFAIGINDSEDDDADGFVDAVCGALANDCDDGDRETHPGAAELCDGRDNGCDGVVDEACSAAVDGGVPDDGGTTGCVAGAPCVTDNVCERGTTSCASGRAVCVPAGPSAAGTTCRVSADVCDVAEACDGVSTACPADGLVGAGAECRVSAGVCDVAEACTGSAAACPSDGFVGAGTECRLSAGPCDVAETCTGSAAACPDQAFVGAGTTCRIAAGLCDVAEACSGASASCPADTLMASGSVCRADVGECDVAETCNGTLASCPVDAYEPSGTTCGAGSCDLVGGCVSGCTAGAPCGTGNACENGIIDCGTGSPVCVAAGLKTAGTTCRAAIGVCDADEVCDGSTPSCPVDVFASAANECRAAVDVCDAAEYCSGSAPACPADGFVSASMTCRVATDVCDTAETCTGSGPVCPANVFASASTQCRASADACDAEETCTGSGAACPADAFISAGTTCRAPTGPCDVAESCTGSAKACPGNGFMGAGIVCRASGGDCDVAEACDGVSSACPVDALQPNGTVCRADVGDCDVAETCSGAATACPADAFSPTGTTCSGGSCDVTGGCAVGCFTGLPCGTGNACENGFTSCATGSAVCIATGPKSASTPCRAAAGGCDAAELCDGSALTCPADGYAGAATVCRAAASLCDLAENCTGGNPTCPADAAVPAGTACSGGTCSGDGSCVTPSYIKASNTGAGDNFGWSVALSADGTRLAVGAPFEASNATGINGDQGNNTAASAGAVYVFARSGSAWIPEAYIKGTNTEAGDQFGHSVSLSADGSRLAVGALLEDSSAIGVGGDGANNTATFSGAVYVFSRTGTTWTEEAYVKASNTGTNDFFGQTVSLTSDGARLAVSAHGEASNATGVNGDGSNDSALNTGAAYVFLRTGTAWAQEAYFKASNGQGGDYFGRAMALSGDGTRLAVGSAHEDSGSLGVGGSQASESATDAGAVYVFSRTGTTWIQEEYIKASNAEAGDRFGEVLALSSDGARMIVGAPFEASSATGVGGNQASNAAITAGAAYVFARSGATWTQDGYLKASNAEAYDYFAVSVAISGDGARVAVGAYGEDSSATGLGGFEGSNLLSSPGAAYRFTWGGATWAQDLYIKATNTGADDRFGVSVALSGDGTRIAVGADREDSNATGVNGNGADNSQSQSGAVYVY